MKLLMKGMFLFGICLFFISGPVHGQRMFITDKIKLTLRTGPSNQHRIIAVIESGQELEILQSGEEWSEVRMMSGKQGWVLTRYLVREPPDSIQLERLQVKFNDLQSQFEAMREENSNLKAENERLSTALSANEKTLKKLSSDYNSLKTDSASYLKVKTNYEQASAQLAKQTQKAEKLEEQLTKIELQHYVKWFLAGSGVLLLGFIVGFSARRQRRRSSLL
ncbi:MAG: TIGR04211 family SH3 domain-containing protein [Desulfobacterales bacterium]|nr:MAG: TIGR04211 family SH3 domain-containing protein [Desulfobacterales bacterium]